MEHSSHHVAEPAMSRHSSAPAGIEGGWRARALKLCRNFENNMKTLAGSVLFCFGKYGVVFFAIYFRPWIKCTLFFWLLRGDGKYSHHSTRSSCCSSYGVVISEFSILYQLVLKSFFFSRLFWLGYCVLEWGLEVEEWKEEIGTCIAFLIGSNIVPVEESSIQYI